MLLINNLSFSRNDTKIFENLSLSLSNKQITQIKGRNGSGKTTLLEALYGLRKLSRGKVEWSMHGSLAAKEQAFVFQAPIMLRRSVIENLIYPLRVRQISKLIATEEAVSWAKKISLENKINQKATLLSGGEMQAIAIARALITKPKMLFLDEPTASLDGANKKVIEDILIFASKNGTKIVMSTHDLGQVKRLADDIIYLHNGIVESHSSKEEFLTSPSSKSAQQFLAGDIVL